MSLVEVQGLAKSYARRQGFGSQQSFVVQDVSFTLERGETLGLVGESGSGKSTIARMLLGLITPTSGSITVNGIDLGTASGHALRALRRSMQPVFQDPYAALNPRMTVAQILAEPFAVHRASPEVDASPAGVTRQVGELLLSVGLDPSALPRYPHEFSGGQRQRINIARALALKPALVVLDEPVSALDVSVGAQIVNLLKTLQRERHLTYLFISHSMPLVRYLSTRIAVLQHGRIVETGESEALCASPRQLYTRALIQATPRLPHLSA